MDGLDVRAVAGDPVARPGAGRLKTATGKDLIRTLKAFTPGKK